MFLEVLTDGGITGLGEATLETRTDLAEQALRWLEQHMIGLDPTAIEDHWDRNYYRLSRWRNGPDIYTALSAAPDLVTAAFKAAGAQPTLEGQSAPPPATKPDPSKDPSASSSGG